MTSDPNTLAQHALDAAIRERGEIGIQVAAYHRGKLVVDAWGGVADESTGRTVDGDTLFPIFSVTKAVTATALHIQVERGLVDYEAPIARYWPEFAVHGKDKGTVYDALTHRLGLPLMPAGVTPELMCDWDWMVGRLAAMHPLFEPGTRCAYQSFTFGWLVGEVVRRTDPKKRPFGQFVQEEVCQPLGMKDLWLGIPDSAEPRVARIHDLPPTPPGAPGRSPDTLNDLAHPPAVGLKQAIFGRPDVRRACIPGVGGIMNARSAARFFAMLAQGGELDGVRLLSDDRVRTFSVPRPPCDYDPVLGVPPRVSIGGFWLASPRNAMAPAGNHHRIFGHTGAGGSVGWADPEAQLAVAFTHNRMFSASRPQDNPFVPIAQAIHQALGIKR